MGNEDIFLETTAIIDYVFKDETKRKQVHNVLKEYNARYSSNYVKAQIRNGYLRWLSTVYKKTFSLKYIADIFEWAKNCTAVHWTRYMGSSAQEQLIIFLRNIERKIKEKNEDVSEDLDVRILQSHIRNLIRKGWRQACCEGKTVNKFIDETGCYRGKLESPKKKGKYIEIEMDTDCKDYAKRICDIEEFLKNPVNKKQFGRILESLKSEAKKDDETKKRIVELEKILKKKNPLISGHECKACSDAIIAVEANVQSILNNNTKHFDPICESIGKKSIGY